MTEYGCLAEDESLMALTYLNTESRQAQLVQVDKRALIAHKLNESLLPDITNCNDNDSLFISHRLRQRLIVQG